MELYFYRQLFQLLLIFSLIVCTVSGQVLLGLRRPAPRHDPSPPSNDIQSAPGVCPCVRPPSGSGCVAYNQKYQASTLEEVLTNFLDTTVADPALALNIFNQKPPVDGKSNSCKSLECAACHHALSERLLQQLGPTDSAGLGLGTTNFSPQVVPGTATAQQCRRLQPQSKTATSQKKTGGRTPNGTPGNGPSGPSGNGPNGPSGNGPNGPSGNGPSGPSGNGPNGPSGNGPTGPSGNNPPNNQGAQAASLLTDDQAWMIIGDSLRAPDNSASGSSANSSNYSHNSTWANSTSSTSHYYYSSTTSSPRRNKRDGPPGTSSGNLGVSTPLDCSYKRGDSGDDNSGYVGLCNLCWSLRTLSPKYFPRYVNELSCDQSDNGCLSGYGKCRERYRSIDVLYNSGTDAAPKWQQFSINSPIACECQVMSGSALHNFVSH